MWTYLSTFLVSFLVALLCTPLVRSLAIRWGVVDQPGGRRIHRTPIPRLGGIAVAAGLLGSLVAVVIFSYVREYVFDGEASVFVERFIVHWRSIVGYTVGAAIIFALGVYDDWRGARAPLKLAVQIGVAIFCFELGFRVQVIWLPWATEPFELGFFSLPFTIAWMVLIINAINLIDGIDGLASGASFFACVTLFILAYKTQDLISSFALAALGGAILGFLIFNSPPAVVFLGDCGSLLLGFMLAAVSVRGSIKGATAFSILVSALALGLPLLDTSLAVVRRMLTGKPIMKGDREHIHHRLLKRGLSQRQAILALYAVCVFLASMALVSSFFRGSRLVFVVMGVGMMGLLIALMRYLGYIQHIREQWRSPYLSEFFSQVASRTDDVLEGRAALRKASSPREVWEALKSLQPRIHVHRMTLELYPKSADTDGTRYSQELELKSPRPDPINASELEIPLGPPQRPLGHLRLFWWHEESDSRPEIYRLFVELLRPELERALGMTALENGSSLLPTPEPSASSQPSNP